MFEHVGSDCAYDAAHIVENEIIGDDRAPSVGAEFYVLRHRSCLWLGSSA